MLQQWYIKSLFQGSKLYPLPGTTQYAIMPDACKTPDKLPMPQDHLFPEAIGLIIFIPKRRMLLTDLLQMVIADGCLVVSMMRKRHWGGGMGF
jgi:hypothetical protein